MTEEKKKSIMVIDDTKPIRILLLKTFEKKYEMLLEEKGIEALETIRDRQDDIDLIILDYEMPKLNGYQLLKLIRNINKNIPVIILSSSLDKEKIRKLRLLGVKKFLAKQVNLKRLADEIKEYLSKKEDKS